MKSKLSFLVLIVVCICCGVSFADPGIVENKTPSKLHVMVGTDENLDACMTLGMAQNIALGLVDNPILVRSGPSKEHDVITELATGVLVWICDSKGEWDGVVFSSKINNDCGVSSPIFPRQPYNGLCKSGWILKGSYVVVAG